MTYYCFLCNENHEDSSTEEHFIPRSIDGPEHQWLPVCETSNTRSNLVFDNEARDILYWVRFKNTRALKRSGEALLCDGTLKQFKFSYKEEAQPDVSSMFNYIYDRETDSKIKHSDVYAIAFPVGLIREENDRFCCGIAKMSIGALAYLLQSKGIDDQTIRRIIMQTPIDALRHIGLNLPWAGNKIETKFSLGRSDILKRLQKTCKKPQNRNHVISINFQEKNLIHIEGMLYSQYGWVLDLPNQISVPEQELRLENPIAHMEAPSSLLDKTLSPDSICILNPKYTGEEPNIPQHWQNK